MKRLINLAAIAVLVFTPTLFGQKIETQTWNNNSGDFAAFGKAIADNHQLNLLAFPGAKLERATEADFPDLLTDGEAGELGGHGRVNINGSPSRFVYYLGRPRPISQIKVCTGNIDQRANQDFEVRLIDNSANPGQMPRFSGDPTFTSGDKVLGKNGGGVMTTISDESGKPLFDGKKYDWVEFKLWRTYPNGQAGAPAKAGNRSNSWSAGIELQVLGDPNDPNLFASEQERQDYLARQAALKLKKQIAALGSDVEAAMDNPKALRMTIEDLTKRYPDKYDGKKYLAQFEKFEKELQEAADGNLEAAKVVDLAKRFTQFRREALLANPLMQFEKLMFRRAQNPGLEANWISNCARGKGGYGNELATIKPTDPLGEMKTVIKGPQGSFIGDIALHWDADKMLVTALAEDKTWQVFELNVDGTEMRQVTPSIGTDIDNAEGCYVPDGSVLFISTASMMGVPCIDGSSQVGNIYRLEADGETVRQLTFEQDQDWCPVPLPNGRIMYLRWEYTDTAHYFTRILFSMNPDGTNQVEHYGSNSFWPNSLFYAKPVPNHPSKFVGIVSGHHGVARMGELVIFDPSKGRQEADGVVQRIPGHGQKVEPIIKDELVNASWPKFLFPYPLDENYYLVSCQMNPSSPWGLYLVDVFDNMLLLREEQGYYLLEPTPIVKQPAPRIIPERVDVEQTEATVFLTDIYLGDGLKDVPRGTVKKLRLFEYSFGYRGIGGHQYFGMESSWDAKRIIGEVPVYEDGSAMFMIPANKPIALQPLDEQGRALQIMRTWFVGMPGETVSCVGCHEPQNMATPAKSTIARTKLPSQIEPFLGSERPFNFEAEIQPILDKYCVGCHDGGEDHKNIPNFADNSEGPMHFSNSYHALSKYTRRPGPESDVHMFKPMEYHASSSELFQILDRGHFGVEVDEDSMRRMYTWLDLNVPYFGTWLEVAEANRGKDRSGLQQVNERYVELKELYANIKLDYEAESYIGQDAKRPDFVKPKELPKADRTAPNVANWPFDAATAMKMQGDSSAKKIKLGESEIDFVRIPAGKFVMGDEKGNRDELPRKETVIEKPFWIMPTEVSNALYAEFDPTHDSRFIDQWWKDHTTPGYAANKPEQPVIRISWNEATKFCEWLSEKTGKRFRLPSEQEWEWSCRAGTDTPMWYGDTSINFANYENLSDESTKLFVVEGVNPQPVRRPDWRAFIPRIDGVDDGQMIAEKMAAYKANPFGLYDMHGGVSEWTSSDGGGRKIARGGSWNDRPYMSRSGVKRYYEPWQKVHNVGFRIVMED